MLEKLKSRIKERTCSSKGAISILMVIFLLIMCSAFALLIDMSSVMFGMKEIQSKMDIAGVNALYNSVDYDYLRNETLGIVNGGSITSTGSMSSDMNQQKYVNIIKNNYINELKSIKYPGSNPVVRKSEVRFEYSDFGVGFNSSSSTVAKKKPQVILESIVSYEITSSTLMDEVTRNITKSVKSSYNNSTFSVTISDVGKDGKSTVMLHSITRIILK